MNKRQFKKHIKACTHPVTHSLYNDYDEYDASGVYPLAAIRHFHKLLKREGIPKTGWYLDAIYTPGLYVFGNNAKRQEITLDYKDNVFTITVWDMSSGRNIPMKSIREALSSSYQKEICDSVLRYERSQKKSQFACAS